jgi:putative aminopeptidase
MGPLAGGVWRALGFRLCKGRKTQIGRKQGGDAGRTGDFAFDPLDSHFSTRATQLLRHPWRRQQRASLEQECGYGKVTTRCLCTSDHSGEWSAQFCRNPAESVSRDASLYTDRVPAFRELLREQGGDLSRFYARVRQLGNMPKARRDAVLEAYQRRAADAAPPSASADRSPPA